MSPVYTLFETLKEMVGFTEADAARLKALKPFMADHGAELTDTFYQVLGAQEATAALIKGRVETLKKTHQRYLGEVVGGAYGEDYFESRLRIGRVHVAQAIDPIWVESVMSIIRSTTFGLLARAFDDPQALAEACGSFTRICDLDLAVINLAYAEERLDRLSDFTGMSRKLIENVIKMPRT